MSGLTFLSWTRSGPRLDASSPDPLTGPLPSHGTLTVGVQLNQRPEIAVHARLYGPGDVVGLDTRQIIRTDPAPGADAAEPAFFPLVEFDRPDLPWLLTPATAGVNERLRPWLVLVVVETSVGAVRSEADAPLPVLRCPLGQLPDLDDSWAWAHAQVATDGNLDRQVVDQLLTTDPHRSLSRLLCPRRLVGNNRYVACVVPAFEAGRKRGLGIPVGAEDETQLRPAWPATGDPEQEIALPVYHHWYFATGPEGDFAALVGRLVKRRMPDTLGLRPVDVSYPGVGFTPIDQNDPAAVLGLEGALRGPGTPPSTWDPGKAARFASELAPLLGQQEGHLGSPLYGAGPAGVRNVTDGPLWLRELNLDPRHRSAAAFGTQVIRRYQEELVASAWVQAAAATRVNEALRQGQMAREAAQSSYLRRWGGKDGFDAPSLLQVSFPVHHVLGGPPPKNHPPDPENHLVGPLAGNQEMMAAVSPAFRRLTRPQGPLSRRVVDHSPIAEAVVRLGRVIAADPTARDLTVNPVLKPTPGLFSLGKIARNGARFGELTSDRFSTKFWWELAASNGEPPRAVTPPGVVAVGAALANRLFMIADDGRLLSRLDSPELWFDHGLPPGGRAIHQPVAARQNHTYVTTADGRLCSVDWDGDRWEWHDHGRPQGQPITGRPLAVSSDRIPLPGGDVTSGDFEGVFVCAGELYLFSKKPDGEWKWESCGSPVSHGSGPPPAGVVGSPGGGPYDILVHGAEGQLARCSNHGNGWEWEDLGTPPGRPDPISPPCEITRIVLAIGDDGLHLRGLDGVWHTTKWPGMTGGALIDGDWLTMPAAGQLIWFIIANNQLTFPIPGIGRWPGIRDSVAWVAAAGRLVSQALTTGGPTDWGLPNPPGSGAADAPPPAQPYWRGKLGFMSNLLVVRAGGGLLEILTGRDLGFEGEVRAGWQIQSPAQVGDPLVSQQTGVALANLGDPVDAAGRDLVWFWVVADKGAYYGSWMTVKLNADGAVISIIGVQSMPTPMSTPLTSIGGAAPIAYPVQGASIAVGDLDGDNRQEMVVAYASGVPGGKIFYRIGWGLDPAGRVTGGWGESVEVHWDRGPNPLPVKAIGVAVADIDNDLRPEILVLLVELGPSGVQMHYKIGWNLNARGNVTGGWSEPQEVPGEFGQDIEGAGCLLVDFSGSQAPDLVVFNVEKQAGGNRAVYRVGLDLIVAPREAPDAVAVAVPRRWTEVRDIGPGGWGPDSRGLGIAVGDLVGGLLDRKKKFAEDFRAAATTHQSMIQVGQQLASADVQRQLDVELDAAAAAAGVRSQLDPEVTVTKRVTERIKGVDFGQLGPVADRLNPIAVAPSFPQPMSGPLIELSQDLLLPGLETVPPDTMTLVRANSTFIEAYMVGLNHEFARELLWRNFPGDWGATYFRQFWDARAGDPANGALTDIPPIADWPHNQGLGAHATAVGEPGMVVLLLRGELLRRYPNAQVFARRAVWGTSPSRVPRDLGEPTKQPQFQCALAPDLMLFGFPLTVSQAKGSDTDPGWFFMLAEHPVAPRFGIPEPPKPDKAVYATAPDFWTNLDWARLATDQAALDKMRHAPVTAAFGTATVPARSGVGEPVLTWPLNSGHLAHITLQPTVAVAVHATDLLPDIGDDWTITGIRRAPSGAPEEQILAVGGVQPDGSAWRFTVAEAVEAIRRREHFHVMTSAGVLSAVVVAHTTAGVAYLRAETDGDGPNSLLALPELR